MSEEKGVSLGQLTTLVVPAFGKKADGSPLMKQLFLSFTETKEAERRILETRTVNPATYNDLEYAYNKAYKEQKTNYADVGFLIGKVEEQVENIKARILMDKYPEHMKAKPRYLDTADYRKSFVQLDEEYQKAMEHLNLLRAYEKLIEGRIKWCEKVCAYMKKQIDLINRSGLTGFRR
jgi:histidinol phosphatase-like PHP family hydrolase